MSIVRSELLKCQGIQLQLAGNKAYIKVGDSELLEIPDLLQLECFFCIASEEILEHIEKVHEPRIIE